MHLDAEQSAARFWFEHLRDLICAELEAIEREAGSPATFNYTVWERADPSGEPAPACHMELTLRAWGRQKLRTGAMAAMHEPTFFHSLLIILGRRY